MIVQILLFYLFNNVKKNLDVLTIHNLVSIQ